MLTLGTWAPCSWWGPKWRGWHPPNKSRSQGSCQELLPGRDPGSAIRYVPPKGRVPVELLIPAPCQDSAPWDKLNELNGRLGAFVSPSLANYGGRAERGGERSRARTSSWGPSS